MADEPENLTLRYLRGIDAKMDAVLESLGDLRHRTTSLESQTSALRGDLTNLMHRFDRLDLRLARIEKRLELLPAEEPA